MAEPYYKRAINLIESLITELDNNSEGSTSVGEGLYKPILDTYCTIIGKSINNDKNILDEFNKDNLLYISALYKNTKENSSFGNLDFFKKDNIVSYAQKSKIQLQLPKSEEATIKLGKATIKKSIELEKATIKKSIIKSCLKEGGDEYLYPKIQILIRIFNTLAISVLKAEYIIFDDFSSCFDDLVGFSSQKSKIESLFKGCGEDVASYIDTELLKSLMSSVWYVIELCKKNKFHDNHGDRSLDELVILNNNRKERSDTIFAYSNRFCFISKHILSSFKSAFESLVDITTIDHHYNYSIDNFNKLCLSIERIDTFKKTLLKTLGSTNDKDSIHSKIDYDDNHKDGIYFDKILEIIKFKAMMLLSQYIRYYPGKIFFEKYEFIIYGFSDNHFKNELNNYCDKIRVNQYAEFQKDKINELKKLDGGSWRSLKNHKDIGNFNLAAEKSIELFVELSEIKKSCEDIKKNHEYDINISENEGKNKDVIDKIESNKEKIIKNPTFFECVMDHLGDVIRNNVKKSNKFTESQKKLLNKCYDIFVFLNKKFDDYLSRGFDYSTLRYQIPFQYSFYKYNEESANVKAETFEIDKNFIKKYGKNCENNEFVFFFASAGLLPLYIDYLRTKHFEYSNDIADLKSEINSIQITETIAYFKESFEEETKKLDKKLDDFREEETKKLDKKLDDFRHETVAYFEEETKKLDKKLDNSSNKTVTLLGIMGSFLTFTTLTIGTIRAVDNITKFILFASTYLIAVISFVFCIKLLIVKNENEKAKDNSENEKKKSKNFNTNVCVIIIIVILVFVDWVLCSWKNDQIFDSPKNGETIKPSITNNSMQSHFSEQGNPVIVKDIKYDSLNKH